jgi:carboxypeptidase PM20D1
MKKLLYVLLVGFIFLVLVVLINTFNFKSKQIAVEPADFLNVPQSCIGNLQKAIQFKTISYDNPALIDSTAFLDFHTFLTQAYPLTFSKLKLEKINGLSLILHWQGKNKTSQPIILMAHQDVVPVEEATKNKWHVDPFSGALKDDFIYGRGTIDDKGSLIAILESVELLLKDNFIPENDIYFVFGHDEEVTGKRGAKVIAALFKQRGIKPALVLDEGGIITHYKVPGLSKPAAVVGIAEKGYVSVDLKASIAGGHSSMPEQQTAIDELAKAIVKLKENQFPLELGPVTHLFMDYVGPEMPFVNKMAMANRWLFSSVIKSNYEKTAAGSATLRTTTATTIFNAGLKENLIPGEASATINFRTLPGVDTMDVINHIKTTINNPKIEITLRQGSSASSQIAKVNDKTFDYLQKTISAFQEDVIVTPYLVLGATDGRFFGDLTTQVFRFTPFTDPEGFHGVNERIKVTEFKKGIMFYHNFIKNYP